MLTTNRLHAVIATCVLAESATAYADDAPTSPPEEASAPWYERIGWGLSAGGGVDDFAGGRAEDVTSVGGAWMLRVTGGTRYWVAGEASYFGSAQGVDDVLGIDEDNANLIGNGLQAAVRINATRTYFIQPFVYSGAAWRHYDLTEVAFNRSDVRDSSDVFELPLGIGVAGYYQAFMADLRTEYRWAWGDEIVAQDDDMDRWNITGNIGMEF